MIDWKNILCTGGSGLLGRTLRRLAPEMQYPSSREFDVTDYPGMGAYAAGRRIAAIFHAAAFTSPPKIDQDPLRALLVNVAGTANVARLCLENGLRLVYVSTDYVFRGDAGNYKEDDSVFPVNRYAWSKLGGECAVRMVNDSLIIRTSFGPEPFPYEKAFTDQWTSREPVSAIAAKLLPLIGSGTTGVIHVGGLRRSVYEYARSVSGDRKIGEMSTAEVNFSIPRDTSLDCRRYEELMGPGRETAAGGGSGAKRSPQNE
jgi:dTDP-4-dehydrorhamnose reductase